MTVQVLTDYTSGVWELIENVVLNQSGNYLVVILAWAWSATAAGSPPWREWLCLRAALGTTTFTSQCT
jgi:hypothetical protein